MGHETSPDTDAADSGVGGSLKDTLGELALDAGGAVSMDFSSSANEESTRLLAAAAACGSRDVAAASAAASTEPAERDVTDVGFTHRRSLNSDSSKRDREHNKKCPDKTQQQNAQNTLERKKPPDLSFNIDDNDPRWNTTPTLLSREKTPVLKLAPYEEQYYSPPRRRRRTPEFLRRYRDRTPESDEDKSPRSPKSPDLPFLAPADVRKSSPDLSPGRSRSGNLSPDLAAKAPPSPDLPTLAPARSRDQTPTLESMDSSNTETPTLMEHTTSREQSPALAHTPKSGETTPILAPAKSFEKFQDDQPKVRSGGFFLETPISTPKQSPSASPSPSEKRTPSPKLKATPSPKSTPRSSLKSGSPSPKNTSSVTPKSTPTPPPQVTSIPTSKSAHEQETASKTSPKTSRKVPPATAPKPKSKSKAPESSKFGTSKSAPKLQEDVSESTPKKKQPPQVPPKPKTPTTPTSPEVPKPQQPDVEKTKLEVSSSLRRKGSAKGRAKDDSDMSRKRDSKFSSQASGIGRKVSFRKSKKFDRSCRDSIVLKDKIAPVVQTRSDVRRKKPDKPIDDNPADRPKSWMFENNPFMQRERNKSSPERKGDSGSDSKLSPATTPRRWRKPSAPPNLGPDRRFRSQKSTDSEKSTSDKESSKTANSSPSSTSQIQGILKKGSKFGSPKSSVKDQKGESPKTSMKGQKDDSPKTSSRRDSSNSLKSGGKSDSTNSLKRTERIDISKFLQSDAITDAISSKLLEENPDTSKTKENQDKGSSSPKAAPRTKRKSLVKEKSFEIKNEDKYYSLPRPHTSLGIHSSDKYGKGLKKQPSIETSKKEEKRELMITESPQTLPRSFGKQSATKVKIQDDKDKATKTSNPSPSSTEKVDKVPHKRNLDNQYKSNPNLSLIEKFESKSNDSKGPEYETQTLGRPKVKKNKIIVDASPIDPNPPNASFGTGYSKPNQESKNESKTGNKETKRNSISVENKFKSSITPEIRTDSPVWKKAEPQSSETTPTSFSFGKQKSEVIGQGNAGTNLNKKPPESPTKKGVGNDIGPGNNLDKHGSSRRGSTPGSRAGSTPGSSRPGSKPGSRKGSVDQGDSKSAFGATFVKSNPFKLMSFGHAKPADSHKSDSTGSDSSKPSTPTKPKGPSLFRRGSDKTKNRKSPTPDKGHRGLFRRGSDKSKKNRSSPNPSSPVSPLTLSSSGEKNKMSRPEVKAKRTPSPKVDIKAAQKRSNDTNVKGAEGDSEEGGASPRNESDQLIQSLIRAGQSRASIDTGKNLSHEVPEPKVAAESPPHEVEKHYKNRFAAMMSMWSKPK